MDSELQEMLTFIQQNPQLDKAFQRLKKRIEKISMSQTEAEIREKLLKGMVKVDCHGDLEKTRNYIQYTYMVAKRTKPLRPNINNALRSACR